MILNIYFFVNTDNYKNRKIEFIFIFSNNFFGGIFHLANYTLLD